MPISDHAHPKIIDITLSFPEFAPKCKNWFPLSLHSWVTVNFRVLRLDWPTPIFFTIPPKHFLINFYVNLYRLFDWSVKEIWLIKKSCSLIGWEHFGPYLRSKNFPKYLICAGTQQIIWLVFIIEQIQ